MKLRRLLSVLHERTVPIMIAEAGWRCTRSLRKAQFQYLGQGASCPVQFKPIGYYRPQKELIDAPAREAIFSYAEALLRGEYPLLGYGSPQLGCKPDWQLDWVSGKSWPLEKAEDLQIVRHDQSDVKAPWELSRLQWAPVLAKAYVLSGDPKYRSHLRGLLTGWIVRNPVGKGVNWTVAMEASLRAISLCLTTELLWPFSADEMPWLNLLTNTLWQHLRFIEAHNEFSFLVRSNHYLSNVVGLTTLAAYLQGPGMHRRLRKYAEAVQREILQQTYADGGDCEASTGYHVLVAQMGLHSLVVQQRSGQQIDAGFEARLRLMFAWITLLADSDWKLPLLGDCDNGRVELLGDDMLQSMRPAGERHALRVWSLCGLASSVLHMPAGGDANEATWLGLTPVPTGKPEVQAVAVLPDSGIAVLAAGEASVIFCAMPNGLGGKGSHTHCDKLSLVFRLGLDEVFCDSGSRCYTRSAELRNADRSTRAHNTLMVDAVDQNTIPGDPGLLFSCGNEGSVSPIVIVDGDPAVRASHRGYLRLATEHRRTVRLSASALLVWDDLSGSGNHLLDLRYILGPSWSVTSEKGDDGRVACAINGPRRLSLQCEARSSLTLTILPTNISREYGASLPATCIQIQTTASLPATLQTRVTWE